MNSDTEALLHRLLQKDEAALAMLFAQYGSKVYSLAYSVVRDAAQAQEVTQDTFLKVWQNPKAWDPARGSFQSWLLTLARYTAIDLLRFEIRRSGRNIELIEGIAAEMEEEAPLLADQQIQAALLQIPEEQRRLIELAFFKGMTHSELAAACGLPLGTVKTRLRLGLQKLRQMLSDQSES